MRHFKEIENLPIHDNLLESIDGKVLRCLEENGQICINAVPGHESDFMLGFGSPLTALQRKVWDNRDTNLNPIDLDKSDRLREKDFTVLCDVFKGTIFENIYNELDSKYKLGRVRIFKSEPGTCLTWHEDGCPRLHYPIKTQTGCFMVIEDEVFHMPKNKWIMADTSKHHTAFNSSNDSRIHLVAVIRP